MLELFFSKFDKVFIEHGNERETGADELRALTKGLVTSEQRGIVLSRKLRIFKEEGGLSSTIRI